MMFNKIFIIIVMSLSILSFSGQHALGYGGAPESSGANNYTVQINHDKESYFLGDSIVFSGTVNKYDDDRNLRISVFDSSKNLIITQKTIVNPDTTFSHDVLLNEKFLEGKYLAKAQYGNSKSTVQSISFIINSNNTINTFVEEEFTNPSNIPTWIKNNAGWWADGQIDDNSFVQGIQFMIKEGLMQVSN